MPRGVGIAGIRRNEQNKARFQEKGAELAADQLQHMIKQMNVFKTNLEDFAVKHRSELKKNPEFRAHFQQMCAQIGVDPLASSKGYWAQTLGVGDYYYELGVQIIEVCMATRPVNGGLIPIDDLRKRLNKTRKADNQVSNDDIIRAIGKLKKLGAGFALIPINKSFFVQSVPGELNMDHTTLLALAEKNGGFVSKSYLEACALNWHEERINRALDHLLKEELAWIDKQGSEYSYWFPNLFLNSS
ncbi:vacuolar-sorting protein SNF8-like [Convolutriloba macropyga]|uniref:vacuolar-sorting protein SNF8-like n=1 Tax=Convolutriloba macropyga TaxID=536237 RepID=UPI003F51ED7B